MAIKGDFTGKELPSDDFSKDWDPSEHPMADVPIEELEAQIERDYTHAGKETPEDEKPEVSEMDEKSGTVSEVNSDSTVDNSSETAALDVTQEGKADEKAEDVVSDDPLAEVTRQIALMREQYEAKLELQQAHSSRLAARLGNLMKQRASSEAEPSRADTYTDEEEDGLAAKVARLEAKLSVSEATVARREEWERIAPDLANYGPEVGAIIPKYQADIDDLAKETDPDLARKLTRAVLRNIAADAKESREAKLREEGIKRRADQSSKVKAQKQAASVSGGAASKTAARANEKTAWDIPLDELDQQIEREFNL